MGRWTNRLTNIQIHRFKSCQIDRSYFLRVLQNIVLFEAAAQKHRIIIIKETLDEGQWQLTQEILTAGRRRGRQDRDGGGVVFQVVHLMLAFAVGFTMVLGQPRRRRGLVATHERRKKERSHGSLGERRSPFRRKALRT